VEKSKMVCENCRFKFEHEDYRGLRCARFAPQVSTLIRAGEIVCPEVYCGIPVSRQFYCSQGEWYDEEREKYFSLWDF
jgi:hypothetical protein